MITRTLGSSGLDVSAIGFGCMGLSHAYGLDVAEQDGIDVIRAAVDLGVTFFDTAQVYGPFTNEELVGKALAPVRDQVVDRHQVRVLLRRQQLHRPGQPTRAHPRRPSRTPCGGWGPSGSTCSTSTASTPTCRSRTSPAPSRSSSTPARSRHFGLSEAGVDVIRRAHAVQPVTALQSEYSLFWREPEAEILPTLLELGIGFVPFSPLGKGFLTGTIDSSTPFAEGDLRGNLPRFTEQARAANQALVDLISVIAERNDATPAQVALAWILAQHPTIVPIPGTTKLHRLQENTAAVDVELDPADLDELTAAADQIDLTGDRYPAQMQPGSTAESIGTPVLPVPGHGGGVQWRPGCLKEARVLSALVGRDRELDVLLGCLDEAQHGRASLVICVGEPGIGKTRLVEELAGRARERGVLTAWGRAAATDGAPPYWPWREVLRALEDAGMAGAGAVADLAASGVEPSLEERLRRFDAMARLVFGAARSHPLLVVLDDLDGADEPSQLLVQHLVRTAREDRLLVLVCCRDTAGPLASLAQEPHATQIELRGLERVAVGEQICAVAGRAASDAELTAVYDATAGNPFFVSELARQLTGGATFPGAVPRSVLDAIGQRLGELSPDCAASLHAAAVLGTRFAVPVVAAMTGETWATASPRWTRRHAPRLSSMAGLRGSEGSPTTSSGTGSSPAWIPGSGSPCTVARPKRSRPTAPRRRRGLRPGAPLGRGRGGRRWCCRGALDGAGRPRGDAAARLRGRPALVRAGARVRRRSVGRCRPVPPADRVRRHPVRVLGLHGWAGTCGEAVDLAVRIGRPDLAGEAAFVPEPTFDEGIDRVIRALCERALAVLDGSPAALRARVLARYGWVCDHLSDLDAAHPAVQEALGVAEASGDPTALEAALTAHHMVRSGPDGLAEREANADRMWALGTRTGSAAACLSASEWRFDAASERGDMGRAARELEAIGRWATQVGGPMAQWRLLRCRAMLAQARGRHADAYRLGGQGFGMLAATGYPQAFLLWGGLLGICAITPGRPRSHSA